MIILSVRLHVIIDTIIPSSLRAIEPSLRAIEPSLSAIEP